MLSIFMQLVTFSRPSLIGQTGIVFAQPWNLFFVACAIVPIALHLWSQKRQQDEPWAAIQFLQEAYQEEKSRLQIQGWLLLLTRVAALVAFAMALAHPKMPDRFSAASAQHNAATHFYLVIDTSYSMRLVDNHRSLIERAKDYAAQIFDERSEDQAIHVGVIRMGAVPELVADGAMSIERLREVLKQVECDQSSADIEATFGLLSKLIEDRVEPAQSIRIVFFSDLQKSTWNRLQSVSCQSLVKKVASAGSIAVVPVRPKKEAGNVSVNRLELSDGIVTPERVGRFQVELQNHSSSGTPLVISQFFDGELKSRESSMIPAKSLVQKEIRHQFETPGDHSVEIRISDDRLNLDNRRYLSVFVPAKIEATMVANSRQESRYVAAAIRSAAVADDIRVTIKNEFNWARDGLPPCDFLVFCEISQFTSQEARQLRRFLLDGGHAVLFLGRRMFLDNWQRELGVQGVDILPVRLQGIAQLDTVFFASGDASDPLLAPFQRNADGGLSQVPTWTYVRMEVNESPLNRVQLRFTNSDPAIVVSRVGDGELTLVASCVSAADEGESGLWSAWPLMPSFPPVVHQLLNGCHEFQQRRRNHFVGSTVRSEVAVSSVNFEKWISHSQSDLQKTVAVDVADRSWSFSNTELAGIYRIADSPDATRGEFFSVNVDALESDLTPLAIGGLPTELEVVADMRKLLGGGDRTQAGRDSTYRFVLAILVGLLVTESTLSCFFGRSL